MVWHHLLDELVLQGILLSEAQENTAPGIYGLEKSECFNLNLLTFISLTPINKLFHQFSKVGNGNPLGRVHAKPLCIKIHVNDFNRNCPSKQKISQEKDTSKKVKFSRL